MRRGDILQFSEIEFLVRSNNQKRDSCTKTRFRPENSEKNKIRGGFCDTKAEENHRVKCGDVKKCSQ